MKTMEKIKIHLGTAPNGLKCWSMAYDSKLVKDGTCGTSIEKPYLDKSLPSTSSREEYWQLIAKTFCEDLEGRLLNKEDITNFEFVCNGQTFKKTK